MAWTKPPTYQVWSGMMMRCYNQKSPLYKYYGGRGIRVCARWHSWRHFHDDMSPRPGRGHDASIERINNDGDYEPGNVRWANGREQTWNTRQAHWLTLGDERLPLSAWARRLGVSRQAIIARLKKGVGVEESLTTPFIRHARQFQWKPYKDGFK